jgi:hypothetical protein
MNDDDVISSTIYIRIARETKHENIIAHCLALATPPRVRMVAMDHGPNVSTPTYVNGGVGVRRSAGRSDIFCCSNLPQNIY